MVSENPGVWQHLFNRYLLLNSQTLKLSRLYRFHKPVFVEQPLKQPMFAFGIADQHSNSFQEVLRVIDALQFHEKSVNDGNPMVPMRV